MVILSLSLLNPGPCSKHAPAERAAAKVTGSLLEEELPSSNIPIDGHGLTTPFVGRRALEG